MSLHLQLRSPPVPASTTRVVWTAFQRGSPCLRLRDRLGALFDDAGFADPNSSCDQLAYLPSRLPVTAGFHAP